ncbi:MAG: SRPBCC family protein [Thermoanaerobaculia bacterium]
MAQPIAAPAEEVWTAISTPGNLEACHPFCARNPVHAWPGDSARDEVHFLSGWVFERRFVRWLEGVGYDLGIGRPGGGTSLVSWRITPSGSRQCTLRIVVYPNLLQRLPVALRWLPHYLRLRPLLRRYLSSVLQGFEWYVTRGEPVPRNQFGRHPWFSGPRDPQTASERPHSARSPESAEKIVADGADNWWRSPEGVETRRRIEAEVRGSYSGRIECAGWIGEGLLEWRIRREIAAQCAKVKPLDVLWVSADRWDGSNGPS